jgi:hypothetical protein
MALFLAFKRDHVMVGIWLFLGYRAHLCSRNALTISGDASGELSLRPVDGFGGCFFQAQAEHAQNGFSQIKQGGDFFMRPSV